MYILYLKQLIKINTCNTFTNDNRKELAINPV